MPQVTFQGWETACSGLSAPRIEAFLLQIQPSLACLYLNSTRRTISAENGDLPGGVKRLRPASRKKKEGIVRKRQEPLPVQPPIPTNHTENAPKDYRKGNSATDQGPLQREKRAKTPTLPRKRKSESEKAKKPPPKSAETRKKAESKEQSPDKKPKKRAESGSRGMEDMDIFMNLLRTLDEGKKGGKIQR